MSQYSEDSEDSQVIEKKSDLVDLFYGAGKPREAWRIGTEYETIGVSKQSGRAVRYLGKNGVEALLKRLAGISGWEPQIEGNHIIALKGSGSNIALEPGGQVELSGKPFETIHQSGAEITAHLRNLTKLGEGLGIAFINLGMQPVSDLDDIEWVPKTRYRIMAPYMEKVGSLGHRMMKQTASVQVNFDYADEADAMTKFRTGMGIIPVLSAMFANSPIVNGVQSEFMTFRGHVWTDTDNARSGLLPFAFAEGSGFQDYVEYALDVSMYFIVRGGRWIDMTHTTFRRFLEKGYEGQRAAMGDWTLHLTTLFPEVRIKKCLEIRCFDNQPQNLILAVPALIKGIFYEPDCLSAAWDLVKGWNWEDRVALYHAAHRQALDANIRGISLLDIAGELVAIASEGLERNNRLNDGGEDETVYLQTLRDEVLNGRCPAYSILEKWNGEWNGEVKQLIDHCTYRLPEE